MLPRRVIVMRHGERVDDLFPGWIEKSTLAGFYRPYDLNMPLSLPDINRPVTHYTGDSVITEMGSTLATLVGKGLKVNNSVPDFIYTTPALRCIQTAHFAMKGMLGEKNMMIRIEPSLFENTDLYPHGEPKFASLMDLCGANFKIDMSYKPRASIREIWDKHETPEQYCDRVQTLIKSLAEEAHPTTDTKGSIIMLVGHASTIDLAIGTFRQPIRKTLAHEFINNGQKFPYCSTAIFDRRKDGHWVYDEYALPAITYSDFSTKIKRDFANRIRVD